MDDAGLGDDPSGRDRPPGQVRLGERPARRAGTRSTAPRRPPASDQADRAVIAGATSATRRCALSDIRASDRPYRHVSPASRCITGTKTSPGSPPLAMRHAATLRMDRARGPPHCPHAFLACSPRPAQAAPATPRTSCSCATASRSPRAARRPRRAAARSPARCRSSRPRRPAVAERARRSPRPADRARDRQRADIFDARCRASGRPATLEPSPARDGVPVLGPRPAELGDGDRRGLGVAVIDTGIDGGLPDFTDAGRRRASSRPS